MRVSTKKGDSGYTGLLGGGRVSKDHTVIETEGALDEANSHIGLARATSRIRRTKRILLLVQKHLFKIGAELSTMDAQSKPVKKGLSEIHVKWLESLVVHYEEALDLPPGFVAFGQRESPSHMDVARTSVRKVERMVVRMRSEGIDVTPLVLKYLNRLSDLLFLLACLEEKDEVERHKISRAVVLQALRRHSLRWWLALISGIVLVLVSAMLLLLLIRANRQASAPQPIQGNTGKRDSCIVHRPVNLMAQKTTAGESENRAEDNHPPNPPDPPQIV
jgi:cob(I)alamin adenosyltransferase